MPRSKEVEDALKDPRMSEEGKEALENMEKEGLLPGGETEGGEPEKKEPPKEEEKSKEKTEEELKKEGKEELEELEGMEEEEEEGKEEEEIPPRRIPKTMPVFRHKIAEKKWQKEKEDLEGQIADLTDKMRVAGQEANLRKRDEELDKAMDKFAEQSGIEPETIKGLTELISQHILKNVPMGEKGISEKERERIGKVEEALSWYNEDKLFDKEYQRDVAPQITDLRKEDQEKIKNTLHDLAFTEEFSKVPLARIFRFEEFDELRSPEGGEKKKGRKTAESASGAKGGVGKGEVYTAEDILGKEQISDEEFDKILADIMKSGASKQFKAVDQSI